jgi:hypothetical protein
MGPIRKGGWVETLLGAGVIRVLAIATVWSERREVRFANSGLYE